MIKSWSNMDWITVQSINQVEQIAVQPMQKAWIMVQNEPIFALRTADNMGLVTTEYYKFEKYDRKSEFDKYVTKDDLKQTITELLKEIKANESTISE